MSPAFPHPARGNQRLPGGHRPGAAAAALVLVLAVSVVSGCGGRPGGPAPGAGATPASHPAAGPAQAAVAGQGLGDHGELAFIAHGSLFLTGGPAGGLHKVRLPGVPSAPAWSADHRWLAVQVRESSPTVSNYFELEPATLWLVNAAGTAVKRLTQTAWDITGFAWSPRTSLLAVSAGMPAPKDISALVAVVTTDGAWRIVGTGNYVSGVAWSPDGTQVAAGVCVRKGLPCQGRLELLAPNYPRPHVVGVSKGNPLDLAGWWPSGSGLLYWTDTGGSASIAADGLPLGSVSVSGRGSHGLAITLVHSSWLAFSPDGRSVAVVSGVDRMIWDGHKKITRCHASGGCSPVAQPSGAVSLDPSWSPDGSRLVFARASASGPFGPNGRASFSSYWIRRWQATSRLWVASASGSRARPLTAAGAGAIYPVWGSDGSLLFVRGDSIWLLPPRAAAPVRVAGPLDALAAQTYYGYVPYPQLIAWTLAGPAAGTG